MLPLARFLHDENPEADINSRSTTTHFVTPRPVDPRLGMRLFDLPFPHWRRGCSSIVGRHLSKSPKDLFGVEFANLKIASPADCYRTCMAKGFPKRLRMLYRGGRTWASNRFTSDDAVIDVIERHDHEVGNLGHRFALPRSHPQRACASTRRASGSNLHGGSSHVTVLQITTPHSASSIISIAAGHSPIV